MRLTHIVIAMFSMAADVSAVGVKDTKESSNRVKESNRAGAALLCGALPETVKAGKEASPGRYHGAKSGTSVRHLGPNNHASSKAADVPIPNENANDNAVNAPNPNANAVANAAEESKVFTTTSSTTTRRRRRRATIPR